MLSIEEIKLLIEKLERIKSADLQKLIDSNLKILKDLETAETEMARLEFIIIVRRNPQIQALGGEKRMRLKQLRL